MQLQSDRAAREPTGTPASSEGKLSPTGWVLVKNSFNRKEFYDDDDL
jgi:hypothetical protein